MDRDAEELRSLVKSSGMNNLLKPQAFFKVESIPKLGSGKTDFAAAKTLTLELLKQADA